MFFSFCRKNNVPRSQKTNTKSIVYNAAASSDVGAVRENNEDKVLFVKPHDEDVLLKKGSLGIVADGMGGQNGGEIGSQMAVDHISKYYYESNIDSKKALKKSFVNANDRIYNASLKSQSLAGMGTTCTAVVIKGKDLCLAHVGDSRAYLVNSKNITKLTTDHTYVQSLLENGLINEQEVESHPQRNMITKCLGTQKSISPELRFFHNFLNEEDLILLCSDGLYEYFKESEIQTFLTQYSLSDAVEHLVSTAISRGGHDNISALIIKQGNCGSDFSKQATKTFSQNDR